MGVEWDHRGAVCDMDFLINKLIFEELKCSSAGAGLDWNMASIGLRN